MSLNTKNQASESPKKLKKEVVLIIILCVLLAVTIFLPSQEILGGLFETSEVVDSNNYASSVEQNLTNLLKNVEGVGNVDVMVSLTGSEIEILAKNIETIKENGVIKNIESVVMVNGKPYVTETLNPKINSVVVVCDGGDNLSIKMVISEIISSALSVPFENIKIYKRK